MSEYLVDGEVFEIPDIPQSHHCRIITEGRPLCYDCGSSVDNCTCTDKYYKPRFFGILGYKKVMLNK